MSTNKFLQKDNINMLWDVISDENSFKDLTPSYQKTIMNLFLNNVKGFYEAEGSKTNSLVDINKKYILLILNYINKTFSVQPNKIKIYNEPPPKELITYEEISDNRKSLFDRDYSRRQEEFENSMTIKAPPIPEFADKKSDTPIKEMDKILKEMQAQRNYEVDQINRNYNNSNEIDNWLKPQETSLKNEKIHANNNINNNQKFNEQQPPSNRLKYLNDLESPKKNVTFQLDDVEDNDIFLKLKKSDKKEENIKIEMDDSYNFNEDRLAKLERNVNNLMSKMDKILEILNNKQ